MSVVYKQEENVFRLTDVEQVLPLSYYQQYGFFGYYIEFAHDPTGFSDVRINLERDEDHGINYEWADGKTPLTFELSTGYQMIKAIYNHRGCEALIGFSYYNTLTGSVYIDKFLDMYGDPSFRGDRVILSIHKKPFRERFRTRIDTKIDLLANTDLDGTAINPLSPQRLVMPNKEIVLQSSWKINPALAGPYDFDNDSSEITDLIVAWQAQTTEIEGSQSPVAGQFQVIESATYGIIITGAALPGLTGRTIYINGRLKFTIALLIAEEPVTQFAVSLMVVNPDDDSFQELALGGGEIDYTITDVKTFDFNINNAVLSNVPFERYIAFAIRFNNIGFINRQRITYDQEVSFLNATETTDYPESSADVVYIHEALNKAAEILTGQPELLQSNFLGRAAIGYPADGCGSSLVVTGGKKIRNFPDSGIITDFKTLFNSIKGLHNMGMAFEQTEAGDKLVIENFEYFYSEELGFVFDEIYNYEEAPYIEIIYNEIRFAFKKYLDEELNTLDEVHTEHEYLTMIERHKNSFEVLIDAIMGAYAIEFTRRQQFSATPTTSWKYDDDIFFMQVIADGGFEQTGQVIGFIQFLRNQTGGPATFVLDGDVVSQADGATHVRLTYTSSGGQSIDFTRAFEDIQYDSFSNLTQVWFTGSVVTAETSVYGAVTFMINQENQLAPEFDQPFESVSGVIQPNSFYNLRHTLKDIFYRYANYLKSGLYFANETDVIRNQFVKNNPDLITKFKKGETCTLGRSISQAIRQGDHINMYELVNAEAKFLPEIIRFEATIQWEDLETIRGNKYKYMQLTDSANQVQAGWIKKLTYNPGEQLHCFVELIKKA